MRPLISLLQIPRLQIPGQLVAFLSIVLACSLAQGQETIDRHIVQITDSTIRTPLGRSAFIADLPAELLDDWLASPGAGLQNLVNQFPGTSTLPDLVTTPATGLAWRSNDTDKIHLRSPSRLSWIVVDLFYTGALETTFMLDLTGVDGVAWSYRDAFGTQIGSADDFNAPQGGRPIYDAKVVIPVRLAPGQTTRLHISALTVTDEKFASFILLSPDQYRAQRLKQYVLDGAYYGLVLALILYNLFLYFALRRSTYLYFCLFAAASAAMIYVGSGLSLVFGLQNTFPLSLPLVYLIQGLVCISGALYSMHLLNINSRDKPLFLLWTGVILINLIVTPWLVYSARDGGFSTDSISVTFEITVLLWLLNQLVYLTTLAVYWRQSLLTRIWFLGITIHTWAMGVWPIILNSAINIEFAPYHLAQLATLINTILLSALIAQQFRTEQTARVHAQQKAVENLRMAHDLQRAKSNFVANVGHDLRAPIQAISHFTEALRFRLPGQEQDILEKINSNTNKVSELIDSMISLSHVEWQGTHPRLTLVSLNDLFNELKTEFSAGVATKRLRLFIDETDQYVLSDRVCLGQIFRNLIENAIKYTDQGEIRIVITDGPETVDIVVWDTGRGIPDEKMPHIFEEFYQVHEPDSSGVGLGLAIVARLCRLLDINISVASTFGYGTRFTLQIKKGLPDKAAEPPDEKATSNQAPVSSLTDLKVAVIGQSDSLTDLSAMLVTWGADVQVMASSIELQKYLNQKQLVVDVILVDQSSFGESQRLIQGALKQSLTVVVSNTGHLPADEQHNAGVVSVSSGISPMQFRSLIQRTAPARHQRD